MANNEARLQSIISQGWMILAGLVVTMMVSDLVQAAIKSDFSEFAYHPGPDDWAMVCVTLSVYFGLAMLTRLVDGVWYRWLNAVFLAVVTLFTEWHQIEHILRGEKVYGIYGTLDVTHTVIGTVLTVLAVRWARIGRRQ